MRFCAPLGCSALALAFMFPLGATAQTLTNPADIKWQDAPPSMPKGAKIAVLHGDPGKDGPFTMRLRAPAGYKVAAHSHSGDEQLTIISGTLYLGVGEKVEPKNAKTLKAGGFYLLPGKTTHFAFTRVPTVVQVSGNGPFDIHYVNPADDPEKMK